MAIIREARPEDANGIAHVHIDSWRTTYKGIVSDDVLANMHLKDRQKRWTDILTEHTRYNFTYIALDGASIVGFASGGPERDGIPGYDGELYAIYLLHSAQRKGIGRQLILQIARHLREEAFEQMLIWVLADNPATHFYQALGGKHIAEKEITIGGKRLTEAAYGWPQIDILLKQKSG